MRLQTFNRFAIIATCFLSAVAFAGDTVVVISDSAFPPPELEGKNLSDMAKLLSDAGFQLFEQEENVTLAISEKVFDSQRYARCVQILEAFNGVAPGRTRTFESLEPGQRKLLNDVLAEASGPGRAFTGPEAIAIVYRGVVTLTNGEKSVDFSFENASRDEVRAREAALLASPITVDRYDAPLQKELAVTKKPRRSSLVVSVYSDNTTSKRLKVELSAKALLFLDNTWRDMQAELEESITKLLPNGTGGLTAKMGGWPPPENYSSLSPEAKGQIRSFITSNWRSLGFESEQASIAFLSGSRVGGTFIRASLAFSEGHVGGVPSYALYELGRTQIKP